MLEERDVAVDEPEVPQNAVQRAELEVEEADPEEAHHDARQRPRHEEEAPHDRSAGEALVQHQGHAQADQGGLDHERADEVERAPEGLPVERVREDLEVVPEPDEPVQRQPHPEDLDRRSGGAEQVHVGEAQPERVEQREHGDGGDAEHGGQNQEPRERGLAEAEARARGRGSARRRASARAGWSGWGRRPWPIAMGGPGLFPPRAPAATAPSMPAGEVRNGGGAPSGSPRPATSAGRPGPSTPWGRRWRPGSCCGRWPPPWCRTPRTRAPCRRR